MVGARRDRWSVAAVVVACGLIAACVAAAVTVFVPSRNVVTGIPDAGTLTELSLPALKALFDLSGALTVGWLLAAAVLVPPQRSGVFDVGGYRAVRAASLSALVWAAASFALVPVTVSDLVGAEADNPAAALNPQLVLTVLAFPDSAARGFLISGVAALVVGVFARVVLRPGGAVCLLVVAVGGLLPLALSGHASASGNHDVAVDTMIFHLVGISVWIGGLVAFLGVARQRVPHLGVIGRRYSAVALVAFAAVAVSGVGNAWVRLNGVSDLWVYPYGRLLLIKAALLTGLGVIGYLHRRRTLPAIGRGSNRPLIRLACVEVAVMAATVGVAAALARTAPPPPDGPAPSNVAETLGFDLDGPPTLWRFLVDWRFDYLLGTAAVVAAGLYVVGVFRLRRRGDRWPPGRTVAWLLGCLLILVATSSGLGRYAQSQFSLHMVAHMILGMCAPILLVLGGPVTLALRALPAAPRTGPPGLREAIAAGVHGRVARVITHPLVVLPLFIGSFYAVYFTGLFGLMMSSHFGHMVMGAHFLVVGYLYYWVIIGVDPAPRRLPPMVKLGMLLAPLPFHAFFGLALMNSHEVLAEDYYRVLALPWAPDLISDQRLGGGIAWAATELPMIIVLLALLTQWSRSDEREARRADRRSDTGGDPELDAYNAMLAGLAGRDDRAARAGSTAEARSAAATAERAGGARQDPSPPG